MAQFHLHSGDSAIQNISHFVEIFEDIEGEMGIKDILSEEFHNNNKNHLIFPFSDSVYWLKLAIVNESESNKNWVLHLKNELTENIELYERGSKDSLFTKTNSWNIGSSISKDYLGQEPYFEIN